MKEKEIGNSQEPLLLLDIHHSGYLGWGVWRGPDMPELWTAETVERLYRHPHYKMGLNLGGQSYEWSPGFTARIKEWLARFPDRLSITGGDYAQPTACVRTGESNLRHLLYGLQVIRQSLGAEVSIWTVSEPGNFAQLPQILLDLGYRGALLRIHGPGQGGSLTPRADAGSVWWVGPDGSRIPAVPEYTEDRIEPKAAVPYSMWIMTRYRNSNAARGDYDLDDLWQWKEKQAAKGIRPVVMSKDDDHNNQHSNNNLCMSSGHLLAADTQDDERFRWVTAEELFEQLPEPQVAVEADPNLFETRKTSFCDYGFGANADWLSDFRAEAALRLADFSTVLAARLGREEDCEQQLSYAWKRHLMAQNHDLSLKGSLHLEYHLQYEAQSLADEVRECALRPLLENMDTGADLGAVFALNPLGWDRTEYVQVALPAEIATQGSLYNESTPVPWEVVRRDAERMIVGFVATVPALGYQVYLIRPRERTDEAPPSPAVRVDAGSLHVETGCYSARLLPEGGLAGVWTKGGAYVVGPRGLCLTGDIGGLCCRSTGQVNRIQNGSVSVRIEESGKIGPHYAYQATYRFAADIPYIAVDLVVRADYKDGEPGAPGLIGSPSRKLGAEIGFPAAMGPINCMRKQPFLVWPYSPDIDPVFAALYWVDFAGSTGGIAMLNRGTIGYRWDADERRVSNILASGSLSEMTVSLALLPHDDGWPESGVHQAGLGFGNPLYCTYEPAHPGKLPHRFQLCRVEPDTVTVSSVFRAQGKSYLRLFEHAGHPVTVRASAPGSEPAVQVVDLALRPTHRQQQVQAHRLITLGLEWKQE